MSRAQPGKTAPMLGGLYCHCLKCPCSLSMTRDGVCANCSAGRHLDGLGKRKAVQP